MENKPTTKYDQGAGQKAWQFISPVALALFLAACSSGIETAAPELAATASGSERRQISSTADDAEQTSSGRMVTGSGAQSLDFTDDQKVGLRFTGLDIPQGAEITKAYVRVRAAATDSGSTTLTIRAHDTDSASRFTASRKNVSSRSTTSASERWSPSLWRKGKVVQSDDLSDVVQEVVSRSGWDSGNALALIVSSSNGSERRAVSANRSRGDAPTLYVWYKSDGSDRDDDETTTPSGRVSSSQREWHKRLLATIDNPKYSSSLDPKKLAATGDLYKYSRNLNNNLTSLMLAYRETGDRDLVRHLDKIMNIAKGKLRDTNGDGYKNWRWLTRTDRTSGRYLGKDTHEMDEMMTHAMVAAAAYTLKQAGYSSSARFWTDYLENDFEAKWRKRSGKRSSFPFIDHKLMHPTTNFIRYHLYMYKLTGDSDYYREAKRLTRIVKGQMKTISTPRGVGYIWRHNVTGRGTLKCQPMVYVRYTTQAMADLATADSSLFSGTFMRRVANTMAYRALKNPSGTSLASDICGNGTYGSVYTFAQYPYAQLAAWDSSGRLETAAERAYAATERRDLSSPTTSNVPAQMVLSLGR